MPKKRTAIELGIKLRIMKNGDAAPTRELGRVIRE
jgi:hypothetical protein